MQKIKVITLIASLQLFFSAILLAQESHDNPSSRMFEKKIETAMNPSGLPNTRGKSNLQKLFFPEYNAMIECIIEPAFTGAYGFRITNSDNKDYILEVKWIYNTKEVLDSLLTVYPLKGTNVREKNSKKLTDKERKEIAEYNTRQMKEIYRIAPTKYRIKSQRILLDNPLYEILYGNCMSLIRDYKNNGVPLGVLDGRRVTFRCVVDDEVWNFSISNPAGDVERFTNICSQIIKDVQKNSGKNNEDKFLQLLKELVEKE